MSKNQLLSLDDTFPFGKYKDTGLCVKSVIYRDLGYIGWLMENSDDPLFDDDAIDFYETLLEAQEDTEAKIARCFGEQD